MHAYMMRYLADYPELLDLMAAQHDTNEGASGPGGGSGTTPGQGQGQGQGYLFVPHLPMDDLLHGIKNKKYYKGKWGIYLHFCLKKLSVTSAPPHSTQCSFLIILLSMKIS